MKVLLCVLAVLALFIIILLSLCAKVHIKSDGNLTLRVGLGPIMIRLLPKKKKKLRLRDFSHKKFLKKMNALKQSKKKKKKKKSKPESETESTEKGDKSGSSVSSTVEFILEIVSRLEKYTSRLYTKIDTLYLSVGGKDPAEAAVRFGVISPSVGLLLELLQSKTKLIVKNPDGIVVLCDYFSEDINFSVDVTFKIRVIDALKTLLEILVLKIKHDTQIKLTNIERQVSQNGRK